MLYLDVNELKIDFDDRNTLDVYVHKLIHIKPNIKMTL